MSQVQGRVISVTYSAEDFYIFKLDSKLTCKGHLFGVNSVVPGLTLKLSGRYVRHPKFGEQFEITSWEPWAKLPSDVDFFLRTCLGVSPTRSEAVVGAFGSDTFKVLASRDPSAFDGVLDEVDRDLLLKAWADVVSSAEIASLLADYDVTATHIRNILSTFGAEAKGLIKSNPYRLVEVPDFPFPKADDIARGFGVPPTHPARYEAAVLWVLNEAALSGHLCVRRGDLSSSLKTLLEGPEVNVDPFGPDASDQIEQAVDRLKSSSRVEVDPEVGVYLPRHFGDERRSAHLFAKFLGSTGFDIDAEEFIASYEASYQIVLSENQKDAIRKLILNKVLVLTGLPGTGKTTVVKAVVSLFDRMGLSYSLMAPTGIAAKRLSSVTSRESFTIHRALGYDGSSWGYGADCKYSVGAVIIDEASMVDQSLFCRLLEALEPTTILVIVGDDAQLPSVGPGNVLRELIRCPDVPTVRLTQIFRQGEQSDIVLNAHRVNRGEDIDPGGESSDFRFVAVPDETKASDLIVKMAAKLKEKDANFQVLSPKYDGVLGVTNLNNLIREALNPPGPGKREVVIDGQKYRDGDRLMVIRNDYDLNVYNGDMGKLMQIARDHLLVRIHGAGEGGLDMLIEVQKSEVPTKLRLAYAITAHKSQGSEFDTIILPMVRSHGRMLQRNLFYTAITRAKKRVWVLGDRSAVSRAISNSKVAQRGTALARSITKELSGVVGVEVPHATGNGSSNL